jgi:hypothetical protein
MLYRILDVIIVSGPHNCGASCVRPRPGISWLSVLALVVPDQSRALGQDFTKFEPAAGYSLASV